MLRQEVRATRRRGFTLVEVMVVVIVIGVLAALVVPTFLNRSEKARRAVAKQQLASIENAINLFQQDYSRFPETLDELVTRPADVSDEQFSPPTLKPKNLVDPWGNQFVFRYPGEHWTFDLYSMGADGQPGGEGEAADVTNWGE